MSLNPPGPAPFPQNTTSTAPAQPPKPSLLDMYSAAPPMNMGGPANHGIDLFGGVPLVYDNHLGGGVPTGMPPQNVGYGHPPGGAGLMGPPMGGLHHMGGMPPQMGGYGMPAAGGYPTGPAYGHEVLGGGPAQVQTCVVATTTTTAPPAKVLDEREKAFDFLP
jgi:hypothetical protein